MRADGSSVHRAAVAGNREDLILSLSKDEVRAVLRR
jgi:hypothetical protein